MGGGEDVNRHGKVKDSHPGTGSGRKSPLAKRKKKKKKELKQKVTVANREKVG